jgi:hypothetical protein
MRVNRPVRIVLDECWRKLSAAAVHARKAFSDSKACGDYVIGRVLAATCDRSTDRSNDSPMSFTSNITQSRREVPLISELNSPWKDILEKVQSGEILQAHFIETDQDQREPNLSWMLKINDETYFVRIVYQRSSVNLVRTLLITGSYRNPGDLQYLRFNDFNDKRVMKAYPQLLASLTKLTTSVK